MDAVRGVFDWISSLRYPHEIVSDWVDQWFLDFVMGVHAEGTEEIYFNGEVKNFLMNENDNWDQYYNVTFGTILFSMYFTYMRLVFQTAVWGWLTWLIWPYIAQLIYWIIDVLTPDPPIIYDEAPFKKPFYGALNQGFDNDQENCQLVCDENQLCEAYFYAETTPIGAAELEFDT